MGVDVKLFNDIFAINIEIMFNEFPINEKEYHLKLIDFLNPLPSKYNCHNRYYALYKMQPVVDYVNPMLFKDEIYKLHLPVKSFNIGIQEKLRLLKRQGVKIIPKQRYDCLIKFKRYTVKKLDIISLQLLNNNLLEGKDGRD